MDEDPRTTGSPVGATRAGESARPDPGRASDPPSTPEPGRGGEAGGEATRSPEEIRADIEQTRQEVGDTVEALAAKTDVKAQAQQRAADVRGRAQQRIAEIKGRLDRQREDLTAKAKSTTPQSAQQAGQQVVTKVRENPAPLALGGAVLVAFLIGRRTGRP